MLIFNDNLPEAYTLQSNATSIKKKMQIYFITWQMEQWNSKQEI